MAKTYTYVCDGCEFDTLAGAQLWECPYCGSRLTLVKLHVSEDPREAYIEKAADDAIRGLEKMLGDVDS